MKPITRKEYYLAKAAGTYTGPTPPPVLREDYYLATLAGDYSGYCPAPVTRLDMFMSAAAGLTSYVPQPVTRIEKYWYAIAKGTGYVPEPVTREEKFLYAILKNPPKPEYLDKTAEGSMILLDDSAEAPFNALTIYGHSTQSGTPSPENPVPIVSAGSVMTTGAQLFDENNVTTGFITDNLIVVTNENWIISDFINCNENQNVCISQENNIYYQFRVCFYNSEKVATSIANYEASVMLHVFSIPENAKYFKISYSVLVGDESVDRGKIMVNYGSTALPWEPYTGGIPGANPYEGEIGVEVSDGGTQSQTLTLSTPGGLPGIPVSSGGNYTDESGQQWICDEIDLARGKYVQRVSTHLIRKTNDISNSLQQNPDYFGCAEFLGLDGIGYNKNLMSDKLVFVGINKNIDGSEITIVPGNGYIVFGLKKSVVSEETVGAVTNYLSENPITILYALKEPIETDLPAEEIAAYKALHTYTPNTTVSNDAAAWMKVGYKANP